MPPSQSRLASNALILSYLVTVCIVFGAAIPLANAQRAGEEITLPADAYKKLDTFEALNLEDADKLYNKRDYKGAAAAYKAYSFEFPKSKATPYVLLRMGRCLHMLEKRNAAIKLYQDVVDYFPDSVRYAAAALFYIGQCHGQNGDEDKQTAVWAKMVKDDDYVAQPNSGTALTHLGQAMAKLGRHDEAAQYQWRTAVNFAQSNPEAAKNARSAVIHHYTLRNPNHEKLSEFFEVTSGFGHHHVKRTPKEEPRYWYDILNVAMGSDNEELRHEACVYWSAKLGAQFPENDDLRKQWIDAMLIHEKDPKRWRERLDKQFESKPKDINRVLKWCQWLPDKKQRAAFYAKHALPLVGGMELKQRVDLMNRLWHPLGLHEEILSVLRTTKLQDATDEQINSVADISARLQTEEEVLRYFARMKDKDYATKCRFDYYVRLAGHRNKDAMEKALAQVAALKKIPKYATADLAWREAELLQWLGRYEEAIKAYNNANRQPDSTWRVADCLQAMKNYAKAIETVRGLESVKETAPQACLRIADIYRAAGDKSREVDQLRLVLQRYPKSGRYQSEAHNRLESYGVALKGGISEADD